MSFDLIAGTCAIESHDMTMRTAEKLCNITAGLGINLIYKGSYDKANRTSINSPRGVGMDEGLRILEKVGEQFGIPTTTDVHDITQVKAVSQAVDVIQTPAFLCRQTDFIQEVARTGKFVNIKKGQFLAPEDMKHVVKKAKTTGNEHIWVCERGSTHGYHDLVSDMRSLVELRKLNCPVVYDVTHSVQQPSRYGTSSGGNTEYVAALSRAAIAVGIDMLFMEVHEDPSKAVSDAATSYKLDKVEDLLKQLKRIDYATQELKHAEQVM